MKKLKINIFKHSVVLSTIVDVIAKNNEGVQKTGLAALNSLLFRLKPELQPDYTITTVNPNERTLNVFDNGSLVCSVEEWTEVGVLADENVCLERYGVKADTDINFSN